MRSRTPGHAAIASLLAVAAVALVGCDSTSSVTPQAISSPTSTTVARSTPVTSAATSATTSAPVSENDPCVGATFSSRQFVGDWTESGSTVVTTLAGDGTWTSRGDAAESGSWSYTPWEFTPAKDEMPASAAGQCVLWLRGSDPASSLVYVPLKVTDASLEMSYVGRGNTIVWQRAS